jgi:hypothetical protein
VTAASKAYRSGAAPPGAAAGQDLLQHLFAGVNERIQDLNTLLTRDTCATASHAAP